MFDEVNFEDAYKKVLINEHGMSILLKYFLNHEILKLSDPKKFIPLLIPAYEKIVIPCLEKIKTYMKMYRIANEGEMFSTDFSFRMCDSMAFNSKQISDLGTKDSGEIVMNLVAKMDKFKKEIRKAFDDLAKEV